MTQEPNERDRLAELLPWHATGRLDAREAARVEQGLRQDAELRRQYDLVLEELAAAVEVNEAAGAPSPDLGDRLMARIDTHERSRAHAARAGRRRDLGSWLASLIDGFTPRQLGWAAAALAVAVTLQASVIAALLLSGPGEPVYITASGPEAGADAPVQLIVAFAPDAELAVVAELLEQLGGRIVEGPLPGGLFRLAFGDAEGMVPDETELIAALEAEPALVRIVLPAQ